MLIAIIKNYIFIYMYIYNTEINSYRTHKVYSLNQIDIWSKRERRRILQSKVVKTFLFSELSKASSLLTGPLTVILS